eukprot:evm.model.scf_1054.2 EVM.evm.TU.scf_1054.2   scf_1054:45168-50008(+)
MRLGAASKGLLFAAFVFLASVQGQSGFFTNDDSYGDDYDDNDDGPGIVGPQFNSPKCSRLCRDPREFETPLPPSPRGELNRAHDWGVVLLNQIHANFDDLTPPGVARIIALVSSCVHDVVAYDTDGMTPVYTKTTELTPGFNVDRAIDGAAFTAIKSMFEGDASFQNVRAYLSLVSPPSVGPSSFGVVSVVGQVPSSPGLSVVPRTFGPAPSGFDVPGDDVSFNLGTQICEEVIGAFTTDGFDSSGYPLPGNGISGYQPKNAPQSSAGITDCAAEITSLDYWQPLCVPRFFGSHQCDVQEFLSPDAGAWTTFALPSPSSVRPSGPPTYSRNREEWERQAREIVEYSSNLSDVPKMLAEFWADGPDTTAPPGHWYRIAMDACVKQRLSLEETVKVLFLVGHALNDAGVASWDAKRHFDFIRPITMIQCGFGDETVDAWVGPYRGVGKVVASEWQPYQATTFVTPAFAGYVSGHSTFSAAASRILESYFGSEYLAPKCRLIPEGRSLFERRIDAGEPGYIPGLTDKPNRGPRTEGYAPATDVMLCWERWEEAGLESGISRFHGGIHIWADHIDGVDMGYKVAQMVFDKSRSYWR